MKREIESILSELSMILVYQPVCAGIQKCVSILGQELAVDGGLVLRTNEIPFLLEMRCLWDPKHFVPDSKMLIDYSENPEDELLNPFAEKTRLNIIEDVGAMKLDPVTGDLLKALGARAFAGCSMTHEDEYLGGICFFCEHPHVWVDEDLDLIKRAGELISNIVAKIKLEESTKYLLEEINRRISDADHAKTRFMNNITNEMRTPLNSAMGMISIMRHNVESPEIIGDCIGRMEILIKQMIGLVSECADMSLVSGSEHLVNPVWLPISSLVAGIRKFADPLAAGRNQTIEYDYDPDNTVLADEVKLARVIINAITYSNRYSPEETTITVSIRIGSIGNRQSMLIVSIKDENSGYDVEKAARDLFDPYSLTGINSGQLNSIGINMAITRHMVEVMNGSCEFFHDTSGTEFVASFPVEIQGKAGENEASEEETAVPESYDEIYIGRRIMIVEDNMMMGEILATLMGYRGLETDVVLNGKEALNAYESHEPFYYDMIFMDIQMPVMDGLEATRRIRNGGRNDSTIIPIIALSATSLPQDTEKAMEAGMNDYLNKPVDEEQMFETINKFLI